MAALKRVGVAASPRPGRVGTGAFQRSRGKIFTAVGTGMLVGGAVMTFRGISNISYDDYLDYSTFGPGLGIMCFSGIPLGYGLVAWITGHERANMIEIELLAFNTGTLNLKPTENGIGLVLEF